MHSFIVDASWIFKTTYGVFSEQRLANCTLQANDRELIPMCHNCNFDKDLWIAG